MVRFRCEDQAGVGVVPGKEVTQGDELAVGLVLNVDNTPAVLACAHGLAVNHHALLRADDSKGNHVLYKGIR